MKDELYAYEAMVMEVGLMGHARARLLSQRITGGFSLDLDKGIVRLGDLGSFPMHLLGTYSYHSETFLWAWANAETKSLEVTGLARGLRDRAAAEPDLAAFTKPQFGLDYVNPVKLASVCGELAGFPSFCGTDEHGEIYLVVETDIEVHVSSPRWLHELLIGFQSGFQEGSTVDLCACVKRFLERCSFSVEETVNGLRFSGEGFPLTDIEFDSKGRVSAVSTATGPTRSKADAPQPSPAELVQLMTDAARASLERATDSATERKHLLVTVEHWIDALLSDPSSDAGTILAAHQIAPDAMRARARCVADETEVSESRPVFSTLMWQWASDALQYAERVHGERTLRTGYLLRALARDAVRYTVIDLPELRTLDGRRLNKGYRELIVGSREEGAPPVPLARPRTDAVSPRDLVTRMTPTGRRVLEAAVRRANASRHPRVEIEHVLERLLLEPGGDVVALFSHYELDIAPLAGRVIDLVTAIAPTREADKPAFSSQLFPWISDTWLEASLKHGAQWIRTGHLFCRLLRFPDRYLATALPELDGLDLESFEASLGDPTLPSPEVSEAEVPPPRSGGSSRLH
jgi:hypothetical protein